MKFKNPIIHKSLPRGHQFKNAQEATNMEKTGCNQGTIQEFSPALIHSLNHVSQVIDTMLDSLN